MRVAALAALAIVLPATASPALAKVAPFDGGIEEVRGLWLNVPSPPLAEFAEDGSKTREDGDEYGYFSFRRGLAGDNGADNRWSLGVDRYRKSDESVPGGDSFYPLTREKAKAFLVARRAIGEGDEVEVWNDEDSSAGVDGLVARSRCDYKTGDGEALTSFDVFILSDEYLFWVNLTAPTAEAAKFSGDDLMEWLSLMSFRDIRDLDALYKGEPELTLEAPGYPGETSVIESVRYVDGTKFKISRYVAEDGWAPRTPEEVPDFIKQLAQDGDEGFGEIKFNPAADARASERLGKPCAGARYKTGGNEDTGVVNRLFVFADKYVFDVEISIDADSYDDYWPIAADWLGRLKFEER
jgi:hypothetical protein